MRSRLAFYTNMLTPFLPLRISITAKEKVEMLNTIGKTVGWRADINGFSEIGGTAKITFEEDQYGLYYALANEKKSKELVLQLVSAIKRNKTATA